MVVLTGSCMCGGIEYMFCGDVLISALCHCIECQKWSGGPATSNLAVKTEEIQITKGECKEYMAPGGSGKPNARLFCPDCGSSLFSKPDLLPGITLIKAGSLDDGGSSIKVMCEYFCKDRVKYIYPVLAAQQAQTMA